MGLLILTLVAIIAIGLNRLLLYRAMVNVNADITEVYVRKSLIGKATPKDLAEEISRFLELRSDNKATRKLVGYWAMSMGLSKDCFYTDQSLFVKTLISNFEKVRDEERYLAAPGRFSSKRVI